MDTKNVVAFTFHGFGFGSQQLLSIIKLAGRVGDGQDNTIKAMSSWQVYLTTLFLGRLSPLKG